MASGTGGIDLLSMYNDDEEEEEEQEELQPEAEAVEEQRSAADAIPLVSVADGGSGDASMYPSASVEATPPSLGHTRSPLLDDGMDYETLSSPIARSPTPPPLFPSRLMSSPFAVVSPSPPPAPLQPSSSLPEPVDPQRMRMGHLLSWITNMMRQPCRPEPEEGEILTNGRLMHGADAQAPDENADDGTPPGTVHIITPNTQLEPPQPSDLSEQPRSENSVPMDVTASDTEVAQAEAAVVSVEVLKDDSLRSFLPPPPSEECPKELQERFNKFIAYKRAGKSFNADLRNRKDYRNPDFLQHAVRYQDIDQIGTCFSRDVFDPHGYDKSDYADEIEILYNDFFAMGVIDARIEVYRNYAAKTISGKKDENDMRREMERKEHERKKSPKVDFVAGGIQPGVVVPTSNTGAQNSVVPVPVAAINVLPPVPTTVDAAAKEVRQNKKTKWDKIDGDVKGSTLSGGHDNPSSTSVHAALLSAANAGAGYTAFA